MLHCHHQRSNPDVSIVGPRAIDRMSFVDDNETELVERPRRDSGESVRPSRRLGFAIYNDPCKSRCLSGRPAVLGPDLRQRCILRHILTRSDNHAQYLDASIVFIQKLDYPRFPKILPAPSVPSWNIYMSSELLGTTIDTSPQSKYRHPITDLGQPKDSIQSNCVCFT